MSKRIHLWLLMSASLMVAVLSPMATAESPADLLKVGKYTEAYDAVVKGGTQKDAVGNLAREVLSVALESPDEFQRWYALRATRFAPDLDLIANLRRIAREADRYEQSLALDALLAANSREAREELIQAAGSTYTPVRVRGVRGLVDQADASLIPTFAHLLASDQNPNIRSLAARGLGRTGAGAAIAVLRRGLHDPSEIVQDEVIQALVALGDEELPTTLAEILARAPDNQERIRWIRLMRYLPGDADIQALLPTLKDSDSQIRSYGAASILAILNRRQLKD